VKIFTLAFLKEDRPYKEQLKSIAKKHGGFYRFVTEKDLPAKSK
jgi:hypothetical protein